MGILHPQSGLFADVAILLFVHILLLFHFPSSTAKVISVPGDIPFAVKLGRDSPQTIRDWIENGANTRIKVKVQYSPEFGFPPEAICENGIKLGEYGKSVYTRLLFRLCPSMTSLIICSRSDF